MLAVGALGGLGRLGLVAATVRQLFDPRSLFAAGEQGVWYDQSDLSTLFQDSAGTTPVTAVEQPVGLMLDKSGRGNHAFQSTAIDRPILRNRYNLLTKTEQLADSTWAKEVSGTGVVATITDNYIEGPMTGMPASRVQLTVGAGTASGDWTSVRQSKTVLAGVQNRPIVWLKTTDGSTKILQLRDDSVNAAYAVLITVTGEWTKFTPTVAASTNTAGIFRIWVRPALGTSSSADILVAGASMLPADQASLPYQRVNTATDYDSDVSKFPLYLSANGTNTWMQTNSIDFTATDKVTVFAGVRKLSDAVGGVLCELSTNSGGSSGAFAVFAPGTATPTYGARSRGSSASDVTSPSSYPAPASSIVTFSGGILADQSELRVGGIKVAQSILDQGTGNYGNYPLYLFRRGGTISPFNGNFYGLLIRGALTSDAQTIAMERWLAPKTGVTLP